MRYRFLGILFVIISQSSIAAVVTGSSVTVSYKATYVVPTCNVTAEPNVDLGHILKGASTTQTLAETVNVIIDCPSLPASFTNGLIASTTGSLITGNQWIELTAGSNFGLEHGTTPVIFDNATPFCTAVQTQQQRSCLLNIKVNTPASADSGSFSVPVTFTRIYL